MELYGFYISMAAVVYGVVTLTLLVILSAREGTLTRNGRLKVWIPLVLHFGIFWGYILMMVVNGLVFPYLAVRSLASILIYAVLFMLCLVGSYLAHRSWWPKTPEDFCPTMPSWEGSGKIRAYWHMDMTKVGWLHMVMFALQMEVYTLFILRPMPRNVACAVGLISAIQFPIGVVQPYLIAELKRKEDKHPWIHAAVMSGVIMLAVVAATAMKVFLL